MKLLINCKLLSVGNSIKTTGFSGCCEYFNVRMCQTVGLWHTITRPTLVALARKLLPNLKPIPLAFDIWYGGDLFQIWERVGSVVKRDLIFTSVRSERATTTISKPYIYLIYPCIYFLLLPNFVSDFGPHVALYHVETFLSRYKRKPIIDLSV